MFAHLTLEELIRQLDTLSQRIYQDPNFTPKHLGEDVYNKTLNQFSDMLDYMINNNLFDHVFEENGRYGLKSIDERILIPPKYKDILLTYDTRITYQDNKRLPVIVQNDDGKYGLITRDLEGNEIVPIQYDDIFYLNYSVFIIQKGDKYGAVKASSWNTGLVFDHVIYHNGTLIALRNNIWDIINFEDGKPVETSDTPTSENTDIETNA